MIYEGLFSVILGFAAVALAFGRPRKEASEWWKNNWKRVNLTGGIALIGIGAYRLISSLT